MEIILFTGAGASKPLNYPITSEFFQRFSDSRYSQIIGILIKHLRIINNNPNLEQNTLDVEDVLSLLEPIPEFMNSNSGKVINEKLKDSWFNDLNAFLNECYSLCFKHYGRLPDYNKVNDLYYPLLKYLDWKNKKIPIFTTNYDPVTDTIMEISQNNNLHAFDGFGSALNNWRPELYNQHENGVDIYRLHGSMSWIEENSIIKNTRDYAERMGNKNHLLIYPGTNKNSKIIKEHKAFITPFEKLKEKLQSCLYLIVIGFSFRDEEITDIMIDTLKNNIKLKIVSINPDKTKFFENYENEIEPNRIIHITEPFGNIELINNLQNIII